MKSVGETMAIGRTFAESLQKALRSLDTGLTGLDEIEIEGLGLGDDMNVLRAALGPPDARPAACRRAGAALRHDAERDPRRLHDRSLVHRARCARFSTLKPRSARMACLMTPTNLRMLKAAGFSDARLAAPFWPAARRP